MNSVASLCGIRYDHYQKLHSRLGMLIIIEGTICSVLTILQEDAPGCGIPEAGVGDINTCRSSLVCLNSFITLHKHGYSIVAGASSVEQQLRETILRVH